jgi:WD40-like Beta Propeller Repeat
MVPNGSCAWPRLNPFTGKRRRRGLSRVKPGGLFEIVFSSDRSTWGNGQPAKGKQDVYISYAFWPTGPWSAPRNLGDAVSSTLSADGKRLYFGRDGDIYVSQRSGRH